MTMNNVPPAQFLAGFGFADGGMVGAQPPAQYLSGFGFADGGQVPQQLGAPSTGADAQMLEMQVNDLLRNPEVTQQIQQAIQQAMQTGELNPQELQQLGQYAQACLQNPALYPRIKQFLEQQGVVQPGDLPEQYDQGLMVATIIAARALGGGAQMQGAQAPGQQQSFASGGMIVGPGHGTSDSIQTVNRSNGEPVSVSNGEYIIPARVVEIKGREFFDNLLRRYTDVESNRNKK